MGEFSGCFIERHETVLFSSLKFDKELEIILFSFDDFFFLFLDNLDSIE